jgi:prepilin-type N-terminal cleavage/methylation domain-containing protein
MRRTPREGGFTLMEVLISLGIMAIGMIGILALQKGAVSASGYSRRATEAAILGEDKLESLRTAPMTAAVDGTDRIDASGVPNDEGPFDRSWTIIDAGSNLANVTVEVTWNAGDGAHTIRFRTVREIQ